MRASLLLLLIALTGCASGMKASADCSYKAGVRYAGYREMGVWKEDPEGRCSFHLEAPIDKAKDAEGFAAAFDRMLVATPKPPDIDQPKMKVEVKQ